MPRKTLTLSLPDAEKFVGKVFPRKIAIVGGHPEFWASAPFDDSSWEIWAFSRGVWKERELPRWDRWFELHDSKKYRKWEDTYWKGYGDFLKANNGKVTELADFPRTKLIERFGTWFFRGGQAPWLIAYAITLNPSEIGIWGIEALGDYKPQRYCIQHFIQLARDAGIKVTVPEGCTLLEEEKQIYQ